MRTPESRQYEGYDVHIGVDVDKKSFSFTVLTEGKTISKKMPSDEKTLYNYISNNYKDKQVVVAYEAGPTGYHLYDYMQEKKIPCLVTPPTAMMKQNYERVKNNKLDSVKIAEQLRTGQLCGNRVPEGIYRELRHLVRLRENYVADRVQAKQRIKALLLFEHLECQMKEPEKSWTKQYFEELKKINCPFAVKLRLDALVNDHEYACRSLLEVYKKMKEFIKQNSPIQEYMGYLKSIPGIGFITASTTLGKIGDPELLKNEREIGCFVGLTPREYSTGDKINYGHISHTGNSILRSLLIEAAWSAIQRDQELRMFYERIRKKNNLKHGAQIAITAVARKMTLLIYRVLKDKRNYIMH